MSWRKRDDSPRRVTGRRLQQLRRELFEREPLCRKCKASGRVTAATERDHIVPLFKGGSDDESNIQPLCTPCHEAKSLQDKGYRERQRIGSDGWPQGGGR